jgi:hypothetical protein
LASTVFRSARQSTANSFCGADRPCREVFEQTEAAELWH